MRKLFTLLLIFISVGVVSNASAQSAESVQIPKIKDSIATKVLPRLTVGGYGEAVMQRMFYSDDVARYSKPSQYKNGTHGRFDLPHVVFYMSYDLGRNWKVSTEIEFEHGGTGTAVEIENEESGEYEHEIEKGGEVALEQFWIEKSWAKYANLRMGHIIVPVGLTNQYHMPTEFFSVLRPEEESSIIPCTWHETGISFWGRAGKWRYEAMFIAGLDAERFNNANWINGGSTSPYEFSIANQYAGAFRVDNYSVKGLRLGLSGYFGNSAYNSLKSERYKNKNITGAVAIGAFDAVYDDHNVIFRGNVLYGHLDNSDVISTINTSLPSASPSPRTAVGSAAMSWYAELGYDVMALFSNRKYADEKLYVYGHYGFYDSMYKTATGVTPKAWSKKQVLSAGVNYFPMKGLVIKAEYSMRQFKSPYNNEPTISLGIGYAGLFKK